MDWKIYARLMETKIGQDYNPNIRQNRIQGKNYRRCKKSRQKTMITDVNTSFSVRDSLR